MPFDYEKQRNNKDGVIDNYLLMRDPSWRCFRYNDRGFDFNKDTGPKRFRKGMKKLRNAGAPDYVIDFFSTWDGTQIPNWIDDAFDTALANFLRCGGSLADRASRVSPTGVTVYIEQSIFNVFVSGSFFTTAAGIYIPDDAEIHVVNFY